MCTGRLDAEVLSVTRRVGELLQKLPRDINPVNLEELRRIKQALVELENKVRRVEHKQHAVQHQKSMYCAKGSVRHPAPSFFLQMVLVCQADMSLVVGQQMFQSEPSLPLSHMF
jgi:hypothetical protein